MTRFSYSNINFDEVSVVDYGSHPDARILIAKNASGAFAPGKAIELDGVSSTIETSESDDGLVHLTLDDGRQYMMADIEISKSVSSEAQEGTADTEITGEAILIDAGETDLELSEDDEPDEEGEFSKAKTTERGDGGQSYPAAAYAYTPDKSNPSTWKIRLWESPEKKETTAQVAKAVAAFGKGFRGNKAQIPASDKEKVRKAIVSSWKKANKGKSESDMPDEIKKRMSVTEFMKEIAKRAGFVVDDLVDDDQPREQRSFEKRDFNEQVIADMTYEVTSKLFRLTDALMMSLDSATYEPSTEPVGDRLKRNLDQYKAAAEQAIDEWQNTLPIAKHNEYAVLEKTPEDADLDAITSRAHEILKAGGPPEAGNGDDSEDNDEGSDEEVKFTREGLAKMLGVEESSISEEHLTEINKHANTEDKDKRGNQDDAESSAYSEFWKSAPAGMRERFEKTEKENERLVFEKRRADFRSRIAKLDVSGEPDELAELLIRVEDGQTTKEDVEMFEKALQSASEIAKVGGFDQYGVPSYREHNGNGNSQNGGDEAYNELSKRADAYASEHNVTFEKAMREVSHTREGRELLAKHREGQVHD